MLRESMTWLTRLFQPSAGVTATQILDANSVAKFMLANSATPALDAADARARAETVRRLADALRSGSCGPSPAARRSTTAALPSAPPKPRAPANSGAAARLHNIGSSPAPERLMKRLNSEPLGTPIHIHFGRLENPVAERDVPPPPVVPVPVVPIRATRQFNLIVETIAIADVVEPSPAPRARSSAGRAHLIASSTRMKPRKTTPRVVAARPQVATGANRPISRRGGKTSAQRVAWRG